MKLEIIEPETKSLPQALGISRERHDELMDLVHTDMRRELSGTKEEMGTVSAALERLAEYCNHQNELVFVAYVVGMGLGRAKALSGLGPIAAILALGKRGGM